MADASVARVVIDSPLPQLDHPFDYEIPEGLAEQVRVGCRVKVPLRGRSTAAYVIEIVDRADAGFDGSLAAVDAVVSSAAVLAPEIYALARRVADRAAGTASDVLRLAVPSRQARVEKTWLAADAAPPPAVDPVGVTGYPELLGTAVAAGERLCVDAIARTVTLPSGATVGHWAVTLAELAARTLAAGRSAAIAVPDYRDQAQLSEALAAVLPAGAAVFLDARQPDADRYRAFLRCLEPAPVVAVGNRSVLYAPVAQLGLIALWDDGDPLYAEPLAPYAHARDVALVRQELSGAALVLAGNTRSVEAQRLVEIGWMRAVQPDRPIRPRIVPTGRQDGDDPAARAARIPSTAWRAAREAIAEGPVLVQVASPGYAPWLACAQCGQAARCRRCAGPLGQARADGRIACRLCGTPAVGWSCAHCGGTRMRTVGVGSARTADELGRAFPGSRVIVADGDHPVLTVPAASALVVATRGAEPVADGGYRAVLLLDGERMLARESLRVGEDCLRWWSNAATLAAPGAPVFLAAASGPVADALAAWDQAAWAAREFADRRALRFPPAVRVASVTGTAAEVAEALDVIGESADVLGPVPIGDDRVRAVLRFDYAAGAALAAELKALVVRVATRGRRAPGARARAANTLRVRFDDPEVL